MARETKTDKMIELISLGGTIAMVPPLPIEGAPAKEPVREAGLQGVTPQLTAADFLSFFAGHLSTGIKILPFAFRQTASANLTPADLNALAHHIAISRADGFVITQGTDTLEETSFLMSLLGDSKRPVVFTGAMRSANNLSADGPANLLGAVELAASGFFKGVTVYMNDQIHDPVFIGKNHTRSLGAFGSGARLLGERQEGRFLLYRPSLAGAHFGPTGPALPDGSANMSAGSSLKEGFFWPRIGLQTPAIGDDATILKAYEAYDGLIVDAFGAGHVSEIWAEALGDLAKHMPVVFAARPVEGGSFGRTYGYKGGEIDLIKRGLEGGGFLSAVKLRLLLARILVENKSDWRHHLRDFLARV